MLLFALALLAVLGGCTPQTPAAQPAVEEAPAEEPMAEPSIQPAAEMAAAAPGPVQITGDIEVSNALIVEVYFNQRYVFLEDLTGFVQRDYEYEQTLAGQTLGPVLVDEEAGTFSYLINLPAAPIAPLNDVDNDGSEDEGVMIWQVVMNANLINDPFLGEDETAGWSTVYTSARIDSENKDELKGGVILVWAPDSEQEFPTGFGDDGLLFTADDPVGPIPAGYSLIDMDAEPFVVSREPISEVTLYEGDIQVNDLSDLSWTEAFDALFEKASREYPFTEEKGIDWQALYDEFAPRIAEAEANNDGQAYYLALRDFSWSIPDGHVGIGGDDFGLFQQDIAGGYGITIEQLTDGRVIVSYVLEGSAAQEAGIVWGAEIVEWGGLPVQEALDAVVPWSSPFSNPEAERVQQLRYLVRDPLGTEVEVTFRNPGAGAPQTITLTAEDDGGETFNRTSVFAGFDPNALPIEYEILDSGYGYIKINSLSDDLFLTIRLWGIALDVMNNNDVPGIIIDLRQNSGGAPIGTYFAGTLYDGERFDVSRSYYYSDITGQLETYRPPDYIEPDKDLYYGGRVVVLVSTACSSACEDVAYSLGLLEQTQIVGYTSTNGIFGEVGRGQYTLPGVGGDTYFFQIPTGLTKDMEGNIIIEGPGVVPDVRVPRTEETVAAEVLEERDVVLETAIEVLNQPVGAGVTPAGPPTVDGTIDLIDRLNASVPFLEDLARESYDEATLGQPGTFTYTIALPRSREVIGGYFWCTADLDTLEDNWSKIEVSFTLDGEPLAVDDLSFQTVQSQQGPCHTLAASLKDWPAGEHQFVVEVTFTAPLNDGFTDYPAGTYRYEYTIYVAR
ncbi:MAG: hypothetical protein Kow00124_16490 [Anaerolineae bacterium]